MEYAIVPDIHNASKIVAFTLFNQYVWELCEKTFAGKYTLIVNDGGVRNSDLPSGIQDALKGPLKDHWKDIFELLPELPKTKTGKFSGHVELHRFEGYLKKIKFIPNK